MASSATKRIWYSKYACEKSGTFPRVTILERSRKVADPTVEAWTAFDQALTLADYDATVVGTYNCRPITGGRRLSLHAYGIATDIDPYALGNPFYGRSHPRGSRFSWSHTEFTPVQVIAVESIRTNNGKKVFLWGGRWITIKDYMHWEIDVPPSSLDTGINWKTVPGGAQLAGLRVEDLQETLNKMGAKDHEGKALVVDGDFGPRTEAAWINGMEMGPAGEGISEDEGDKRYVRRNVNVTSKFS